jgi:hypothetical protein
VIKNTNDTTTAPPRLKCYINTGNLFKLPAYSSGPQGDELEALKAAKAAGFQGVQFYDPAVCRELGLGVAGMGRVNQVEEVDPLVSKASEQDLECVTLHVGWGMEPDDQVWRLVEAVLQASQKYDIPLYIETHRSTITQDIWRTVQLVNKFPEIRFNGDFSHWYTGQEMVYGGFENKLAFLAPVMERVRFMHGRIGNPGSIQVDIGDGQQERPYIAHFKAMWTQSFAGFLKSAGPGDYFIFAPELLNPEIYYARTFPNQAGQPVEEGDRWQQALLYNQIAQECFDLAHQSLEQPAQVG